MKLPEGLQGIGIPFFSEPEWHRARAVIDDSGFLGKTYREFVVKVEQFEDLFRRKGQAFLRIRMTIDELIAWHGLNAGKIDAKACAKFAGWRVSQIDARDQR